MAVRLHATVKHKGRQVIEIVGVGAAHGCGQERGRLVEQGAVADLAILHSLEGIVDTLEDSVL